MNISRGMSWETFLGAHWGAIAGILPRPNGEWRNHQGLDNRLLEELPCVVDMDSAVVRHGRLGGILNYYERRAG